MIPRIYHGLSRGHGHNFHNSILNGATLCWIFGGPVLFLSFFLVVALYCRFTVFLLSHLSSVLYCPLSRALASLASSEKILDLNKGDSLDIIALQT